MEKSIILQVKSWPFYIVIKWMLERFRLNFQNQNQSNHGGQLRKENIEKIICTGVWENILSSMRIAVISKGLDQEFLCFLIFS